jgi:hypothetical protein
MIRDHRKVASNSEPILAPEPRAFAASRVKSNSNRLRIRNPNKVQTTCVLRTNLIHLRGTDYNFAWNAHTIFPYRGGLLKFPPRLCSLQS